MSYSFPQRLSWAIEYSKDPIWEKIYRSYFPTVLTITNHYLHSGPHQQQGIDRALELSNGSRITIEEKIRKSGPERADFLIEFENIGKNGNKTPGWVEKPLTCDYLMFHYKDSQESYLFPWPLMQQAWWQNKAAWLKKYEVLSIRREHNTLAIPREAFYQAIVAETYRNFSLPN